MSFQYVLIPAVDGEPIASYTASKEGGLSNDALNKNVKQYFDQQQSTLPGTSQERLEMLDNLGGAEKQQICARIRASYAGDDAASRKARSMTDDQLIQLLKHQEQQQSSRTVEITCLTIPTPLNGHTAVSMYGDDHARIRNSPYNARATNLMLACGHAFPNEGNNRDGKPNGIYGDVFVGRAIDDEVRDIWERVDLIPDEVQGNVRNLPWTKVARKKGGGGGRGGAAASLSKTLQDFQNRNQPSPPRPVAANAAPGGDDEPKAYKWTQSDDEVELRFVVPKETKSKNVRAKFGTQSLRVTLIGVGGDDDELVLCNGETWDKIDVDGSTFTLQDEPTAKPTGRELCVSLEKQDAGQTWNYAIEE
mmetsp:Transcript_19625/g.45776  ORF Transcript_19625/g.45776 Transcript_19625/m.45776 type:complete len:363 (+) Transcript_19625:285-1373(+)